MRDKNLDYVISVFLLFALSIGGIMLRIGFGVNVPWTLITAPIWGPFAIILVLVLFAGWVQLMILATRGLTQILSLGGNYRRKDHVNMINPRIKGLN